ncbi:MAG: M20 family metallopeptidase [Firmicutes bacterium]|nr:M20 family metallopeptidase [Bacillota bacterium]
MSERSSNDTQISTRELERLASAVDTKELIELTRRLVRIPSVYRPSAGEAEGPCAEFVADYLRNLGLPGLEVKVEEVAPGRPNVIGVLSSGEPGRTLLYEGHTDVVTEGDRAAWTHDPFGAEIVDGRIYGRGSCDTKGNLAAAIIAVRALVETGMFRKGRIVLAIPVDEEGLMLGIKHFIRAGHAAGVDAAVICEPEENQLCITQKGAMRAVVRTRGVMAHGAMPLSGVNPIPRMAAIIAAMGDYERAEKARLGCHPYLGWPSITPTIVSAPVNGEPQINVIPDEAYMTLDIRTIPGQDHAEMERTFQGILARLAQTDPDFKAEIEIIERRPWTETGLGEPIVRAFDAAYRIVSGGKEPTYNGVPGATDGTFLNAWAGIPILTTGAGNRLIPHQKDEYVDIAELEEAARLYAVAGALFLGEA